MCTSPLIRYRAKYVTPNSLGGSSSFTVESQRVLEQRYGSYSAFKLYFDGNMDYQVIKCRHCSECRAEYARDWAIRCANEFQIRGSASFITLTIDSVKASLFNDEKNLKRYCKRCVKGNRYIKYPVDYTLCKGMLLDELKLMRDKLFKRYGIKIRYFGCGEYGSNGDRPHYHIIIFGYNFPDKKQVGTSKKGVPIYVSDELSDMWKYGISTIQDCNFRACMYTAKYCLKKIKSNDDIVEYEQYYGREPEFLVMSKGNCQSNRCPYIDDIVKNCKGMKSLRDLNNPYCKSCDKTRGGIGYDWFLKYYRDVLKIGYMTVDGVKYPIPKYYLELLKLTDSEMYDKYKLSSLERNEELKIKNFDEYSQARLDVRSKVLKSKLHHSSRL